MSTDPVIFFSKNYRFLQNLSISFSSEPKILCAFITNLRGTFAFFGHHYFQLCKFIIYRIREKVLSPLSQFIYLFVFVFVETISRQPSKFLSCSIFFLFLICGWFGVIIVGVLNFYILPFLTAQTPMKRTLEYI